MHSQQAIEKIASKPNIEQVLKFMKDQRARAFVLDIETDSTIIADENAEKQRRTEFVGQLGTLMPQLAQMIAADPGSAQLCGDILKFATAPFRSGRELDGSIDDYVEQIKARGEQGKGDDPTTATNKTALQIEQMKQKTEKDKNDAMNALKAQELQMKDRHETMKIQSMQQIEMMKMRQKQQDDAAKAQQTVQKTSAEREAHQMDMVGKQADMEMNRQKMAMTQAAHVAKQQDMQARQGRAAGRRATQGTAAAATGRAVLMADARTFGELAATGRVCSARARAGSHHGAPADGGGAAEVVRGLPRRGNTATRSRPFATPSGIRPDQSLRRP